ncbi:hypothetical protein ACPOL_3110 [Acidisarcina polymorpha]|uniref:Uncharacterized protein n=1 Tax=Acidisarcina polymorpha TaxID=2211140 RepID=A0A2Z5G191_9BACT|nr:hypothetical protein ACPOL_3110 [Acidisarcina polymorpha]
MSPRHEASIHPPSSQPVLMADSIRWQQTNADLRAVWVTKDSYGNHPQFR